MGDCAATYEIVYDDAVETCIDENPCAGKEQPSKKPKTKANWKHEGAECLRFEKSHYSQKEADRYLENCLVKSNSSVQLFESQFDSDVFDLLTLESNRYAK
ncbi:MAG: hypothetical protein AAGK05_18785, partial [Pseudomonadota bacterium]